MMDDPKEHSDTMWSGKTTSLDPPPLNMTKQPRSMDGIGTTAVPNGKTRQPSKHKQKQEAAVAGGACYVYRDLGSAPLEDYSLPSNPRSWEAQRFPVKLVAMLTDPGE